MRCEHRAWTAAAGWDPAPALPDAGLVLYFGGREALASGGRHRELQAAYPGATLLGCSTGGHMLGAEIDDEGVVATAIRFGATRLRLARAAVRSSEDSHEAGLALGRALAAEDLCGVLVLSDGLHVNGTRLLAGLAAALGTGVPLSGGLAGDGARFAATLVGAGDRPPEERLAAAVGFYGGALRIGHGRAGGWAPFGPKRRVTRSRGNLLLELDGQPALDLYERYLGEEAAGMPGTALLYPLLIWDAARPQHDVVRTVLGVDRAARTMTFAGDIPEGWIAQLMHGHCDDLVAAAADAAGQAAGGGAAPGGDRLAIMVSCIGRRLVLGQSATDEIAAAAAELPGATHFTGFYSYGEIAPHAGSGACELHNQSMTVTTLAETAA
ncbi:FIST signal transduction protein [Paeniroseomonas aquatica]|uniref:FIST N-terminal domain-containing protein n=1 Tax=Paeniroseomonas aquatica TaxID=373043 RepID=A0ABT8AFR7_9PROT|nr:FIST N-terminal domain-containing protein [Paeniroseomonas aquatica]MDN3568533.1 FIST N-terminal domain-containing protein [Paeniroseomonas aquatica]